METTIICRGYRVRFFLFVFRILQSPVWVTSDSFHFNGTYRALAAGLATVRHVQEKV